MIFRSLALCAAVLALGTLPAAAFDHVGFAKQALEQHILPGYERFDTTAKALADQAHALCKSPSAPALAATRAAAGKALNAWGQMEHIRFGPITEDKRLDRLLFYPDPRSIARKQIDQLLRKHDEADIDPAKLARASVAVQGFTGLDRALFGKGSDKLATPDQASSFRCRYVAALADGIAEIAASTLAAWSGPYRKVWLEPGPQNRTFLSPEETTQALLRAYVTELEAIRLQRLEPVLADAKSGARVHPLLPDSHLGVAFIVANVEGVRGLLTEGGFTDPAFATDEKEQSALGILESVATDLGFALRAGNNAMATAPDVFASEEARAKLAPLVFSLKNAEETGRSALGALTGQALGFNSLDGD